MELGLLILSIHPKHCLREQPCSMNAQPAALSCRLQPSTRIAESVLPSFVSTLGRRSCVEPDVLHLAAQRDLCGFTSRNCVFRAHFQASLRSEEMRTMFSSPDPGTSLPAESSTSPGSPALCGSWCCVSKIGFYKASRETDGRGGCRGSCWAAAEESGQTPVLVTREAALPPPGTEHCCNLAPDSCRASLHTQDRQLPAGTVRAL